MKRLLSVFLILIFLISCNRDGAPVGVIAEEKMISLLTDIHLIDGYILNVLQDTIKPSAAGLHESVFKKHKTDSIQFRKSMQFYSQNPDKLRLMYEKVTANLDTLRNEFLREKLTK